MGEVELVVDDRLGRAVAVKRLLPTASRVRFEREIRVQARLEHPAIVPVYDVGEADGRPYFIMKRVVGTTLAAVLAELRDGDAGARARHGRRRLLSDFVQVCHAVAYAHDRGVVHRDLKPANVMLGEYGEVYVLDWGVAKILDETDLDEHATGGDVEAVGTVAGALVGTVGYMAPEQLAGAEVDRRADVYALGAILFEMVTLQRLHAGASFDELAASTRTPPQTRIHDALVGLAIDDELEQILLRATAPARDDRYADVRALLLAVEAHLDGDRDLEQRRAQARAHLERAAAAASRSDDEHAHAEAMREVGRALTLAPGDAASRTLLAKLLLDPPTRVPAAVHRRLDEAYDTEIRRNARLGADAMLAFVGLGVLAAWMGVRDLGLWSAMLAVGLVIVAISWSRARRARGDGEMLRAAALHALLMALVTRIAGPLYFAPLGIAVTTGMFMFSSRNHRAAIIGMGLAAMTIPMVLEALGVIAPSYTFEGDRMIIHANMLAFPPLASTVMFWATNAMLIVAAGLASARAYAEVSETRRRLAISSWQYEQVLVDERSPGATQLHATPLAAAGVPNSPITLPSTSGVFE